MPHHTNTLLKQYYLKLQKKWNFKYFPSNLEVFLNKHQDELMTTLVVQAICQMLLYHCQCFR